LQPLNQLSTIGAIGLGFATFIFIWNIVKSLAKAPDAPANPWHSNTLEWTVPSPPGHGNFPKTPVVYHGAYEYSVPGMDKDYLPQTEQAPVHVKLDSH
jgi:cytochrome c oxidase subunit 1